jgi:hypothetical protein
LEFGIPKDDETGDCDLVYCFLFSSDDPTKEMQIYIGETDHLLRNGFIPTAPTKIICHGFMSDYLAGPGFLLNPGTCTGIQSIIYR